jgi:hypothetical protein
MRCGTMIPCMGSGLRRLHCVSRRFSIMAELASLTRVVHPICEINQATRQYPPLRHRFTVPRPHHPESIVSRRRWWSAHLELIRCLWCLHSSWRRLARGTLAFARINFIELDVWQNANISKALRCLLGTFLICWRWTCDL